MVQYVKPQPAQVPGAAVDEEKEIPLVAVGAGEDPPWGDDRSCPRCGEPDLPLLESSPSMLSYIAHCGGAWIRGPLRRPPPVAPRASVRGELMSALKHKIRCSLCEDVPVPAVFLLPRYSDPVAWGGMPTYVGVCAQHAEAWWDGDEPPQEATHYALTEVPAASLRPVPSSSVGRMAPRERRED